ncbi:selenium metabolism protein YedF [Desulfocicer vacuolatum DSM 3385]|uniref:Selenium metabolism protein YedF n=1 Tax=Desulfocicer vacuolatum DSM 3385 TaxID=1121400 RepID=A0A1W2CHG8_9BACT|nr:sulfurtransferase-like selenium metabolism protein YedF [Desulfocicer vacuolatum]SMC84506.1 selenium metabolism protein YedF [Desulfocicer vacuolatum DSM 3385]
MIYKVDARGLACPEPVLKTKAVIENPDVDMVQVQVDNDAAVENVSRFLTYQGFQVSVDSHGVNSTVEGVKKENDGENQPETDINASAETGDTQKMVVMIGSRTIGQGDDELGKKLMMSYIRTLKEMGDDLWRLIFVNGGVYFATEGAELLPDLMALEEQGITILVCGTCLNHFDILEKKKVGQTTNMLDIITAMQLADKVISL